MTVGTKKSAKVTKKVRVVKKVKSEAFVKNKVVKVATKKASRETPASKKATEKKVARETKYKIMTIGENKFRYIPFENLDTSTQTVMAYANVKFNVDVIFRELNITEVEVPYTRKQKNVDKKKLNAPYGAIISSQFASKIRGINLRKKKYIWCTVCQPTIITDDEEEVCLNTVSEYTVPNKRGKIDPEYPKDTHFIKYYCERCERSYDIKELKKINHFLNQLTMVLSVGKQPLLNIMMFKDNMKIAGSKSLDDAKEAIMILWRDYLSQIPDSFSYIPGLYSPVQPKVKFIFDTVMRNVDFSLGFPIERDRLNKLMNKNKYSDKVHMSQYESTSSTNVNIKIHAKLPPNYTYDKLVILPNKKKNDHYFGKSKKKRYVEKKEKKKDEFTTLIVFSSSEAILSGKYDVCMKEAYRFFIRTALRNKSIIQENIKTLGKRHINDILSQVTGY